MPPLPDRAQLSALNFNRQFKRFKLAVRAESGRAFDSFHEGLPADWEEYKEQVRNEAIRRLDIDRWKRAHVGTGRILEKVITAIEINVTKTLRNNLVTWYSRFGPSGQSHRALLDARTDASARRKFERWFFDFFKGGRAGAQAFDSFRELAGDRYDLVGYLFFLKDWQRFMPVRPKVFDEAFRHLGIDLVTAYRCSWSNYVQYNDALRSIHVALREQEGIAGARLIDAHSFCWMLVKLKPPKARRLPVIPLPRSVTGLRAVPRPSSSAPVTAEGAPVVGDDDWERHDATRRKRGKLAQDIALQSEWRRLEKAGHPKPQEAARPVWDEPSRGYDILSCELNGTPRHIEVKSVTRSGKQFSFFLTPNERRKSRALPNYFFYLVFDAEAENPDVRVVEGGNVPDDCLTPASYLASLSWTTS